MKQRTVLTSKTKHKQANQENINYGLSKQDCQFGGEKEEDK